MKKTLFFLILCTFSQLAQAKPYCNTQFNYCFDVPIQLTWQGGRSFKLENSKSNIWIYGSYEPSVFFLTDKEFLQQQKHSYHTENTVTYERMKGDTYTVSGYDKKGDIFYNVIKAKNGTTAQLQIIYPKSERKKMDSIVKQMARSFKLY